MQPLNFDVTVIFFNKCLFGVLFYQMLTFQREYVVKQEDFMCFFHAPGLFSSCLYGTWLLLGKQYNDKYVLLQKSTNMFIFVAGLPYDLDDAELEEIFEKFGTVKSAKEIGRASCRERV